MRGPISLSRYLAGSIAFFIAPLILASGLSLWSIDMQARRSFARLSLLSSSLVSSRFDEFFARPREAAYRLTAILGQPDLYPRSRLPRYLEEVLAEYPFLDRVQVLGADDRVAAVAPADPGMIGISRKGELVYEEIKDSKGLRWSDSYISALNNEPALTFGLRAGSETLLCDLNLDWVGDFSAAVHVPSDPEVEVRITDRKGFYVSNLDRDRVGRRERMPTFVYLKAHAGEQTIQTLREGGVDWLVSTSRISDPDWYAFVLYPGSVFSESLILGYAQLLAFLIVLGLVGLILWRRRFARVSGALAAISSAAESISRGNYGELAEFGAGFAEFGRVAVSLNAMVSAIGRRERVLVDRERGFRETLERIELAAIGVDGQGIIRFVNPFFMAVSGFGPAELEGRRIVDIMVSGPMGCPFSRLLAGERILSLERYELRTRAGERRLIDWSIVRTLDSEGRAAGAMGIGHDVTEMVRQQELVANSLLEKEILLREVHHRVKNNLQIILSLLRLQEDETREPSVIRALGISADRILSIALVHETIYGSEDFADLDFGKYALNLATKIVDRQGEGRIRLETDLEILRLDLFDSVPCGLFVGEAIRQLVDRVRNESGSPPGAICLSVRRMRGEAFVTLSCSRGQGGASEEFGILTPHFEDEALILALAEQLHGKLSIRAKKDFIIELSFRPRARETSV